MFKLKTGYFISGIITGLILLLNFFSHLPDGKLHIIFCDVGQGDAAYIMFPGGRDMLIDGGPGGQTPKVLGCLARYMSIFDRTIDVVILSHPEEDHMGGVSEIVKRYTVGTFVRSDVSNTTEGFKNIQRIIKEKQIKERIVAAGETIAIGSSELSVLWPNKQNVASTTKTNVLGVSNINDASVVLKLSYGMFDAVFPGDADSHIDEALIKRPLMETDGIEVLKVPHHGSKTGMTDGFLSWLGKINLAIISVGKNSFGHPAPETIQQLEKRGMRVMRTDQDGNIEIITDGTSWTVKTTKTK
ncbi:MAG: MBL fold metallo-hydrolase [Candidatus Gottesmanbacteria bacterium]